jgi:hypothetical protein
MLYMLLPIARQKKKMLYYVAVTITVGRIQRMQKIFSNKCMYESVSNVVCCTVDIFTAHKILCYTLRVSLMAPTTVQAEIRCKRESARFEPLDEDPIVEGSFALKSPPPPAAYEPSQKPPCFYPQQHPRFSILPPP